MIIELSKATVELKDELNWWDVQEIRATQNEGMRVTNLGENMTNAELVMDAKTTLQMTIKTFEKVIMKITEDGKSFSFSENWLKTLNQEDGDKLFDEVNKVAKLGKK